MENTLSSNHIYMENKTNKKYDLENRTFIFAQNVKLYVDQLPNKTTSFEIGKQLIRSAGSVGANYIEANESLSKKDFLMRIKICKKEAEESKYWIKLSTPLKTCNRTKNDLINESEELMKIFGTKIRNTNI